MKKNYFKNFFAVSFLLSGLFSCNLNDLDNAGTENKELNGKLSNEYNVTLSDVQHYAAVVCKKDTSSVMEIVPIVTEGNDTLAYIVNYSNGWEVIGGDKRVSPVLAYNDFGKFDVGTVNPNIIAWLDDMTDRIYAMRYNGAPDSISGYYQFWKKVSTNNEEINKGCKVTQQYKMSMLRSTTAVGHLIQTKWGQNAPWNKCVPYTTDYITRCPTGCVAVAGAQMLYFLHYKIGKPVNMYSQGSCIGWANGDNYSYSFSFSNPTSTVWDAMAKYYWQESAATEKVAILMGYVGCQVGMKYDDTGSSANTESLVGSVFNPFGISCSYSGYHAGSIVSSLNAGMPVIIRAYGTKTVKKFLGITIKTTYSNGHAWIVDGYESNGTDVYFKMNWGWEGYYDDGSFLDGSSWNISNYNFTYKREMISGFSAN